MSTVDFQSYEPTDEDFQNWREADDYRDEGWDILDPEENEDDTEGDLDDIDLVEDDVDLDDDFHDDYADEREV
jgi:hypothetical protein